MSHVGGFQKVGKDEIPVEWRGPVPAATLASCAARFGIPVDKLDTTVVVVMPECMDSRTYMLWMERNIIDDQAACMLVTPSEFVSAYGNYALQEWASYFRQHGKPNSKFVQRVFYPQ